MDSVSQNTSFVSLNGIDQTQEIKDDVDAIKAQIRTFQENIIPYLVRMDGTDARIDGFKTFVKPITLLDGILVDTKELRITSVPNLLAKPFELIFHPSLGFAVNSPIQLNNTITVPDNAFLITKVAGLEARLKNVEATSVNTQTIKMNSNTLLNVQIPFQPSCQEGSTSVTITDPQFITFFTGYYATGVYSTISANSLIRYRHPFNYCITHVSALFDVDTITSSFTTEIIFYLHPKDGSNPAVQPGILGKATFVVGVNARCDCFTFEKPLIVPNTYSLGGTHKFSRATGIKECTYVLHGNQI